MNEDQQPETESASVKLDLNMQPLEEMHNDLMYIALGVSVVIVMLWGIAKRIDDLELTLTKVVRGIQGNV